MPPGQRSQYGGNVYWSNQPKSYPTMPKLPIASSPSRTYEADIIRNATRPASIASIMSNAPALGTTSRAYANAHGSQAGLNIPGSTYATQSQGAYAPAASARLSGSGGSGGGSGAAAPVDPLAGWIQETPDLSRNPIPGLYDDLLAYVKTNSEARPGEYQALADKFTAQQKTSDQQLYDAYLGSRQGADASATAFGVDPAVISQARDLAMRQSQEKSDQALASNQAFLQKMGLLSEQQGQAYGYQYAGDKATKSAEWADLESNRVLALNVAKLQALVDAQNAKKSGGGGGGRRGGGSKSSSSDTGVTETNTLPLGGADAAAIADLIAQGDYEGAAAMQATVNRTMGNAAVKANQSAIDTNTAASIINGKKVPVPSKYFTNPTLDKWMAPTYKAAQKAATNVKIQNRIMPSLQRLGGLGTQPYTKIVTVDKGKAPR